MVFQVICRRVFQPRLHEMSPSSIRDRLGRANLTVRKPFPRLTLFGRSLVLLTSELLANAICWVVCAILFGRNQNTRSILSLALLAWVRRLLRAIFVRTSHEKCDRHTGTLLDFGWFDDVTMLLADYWLETWYCASSSTMVSHLLRS